MNMAFIWGQPPRHNGPRHSSAMLYQPLDGLNIARFKTQSQLGLLSPWTCRYSNSGEIPSPQSCSSFCDQCQGLSLRDSRVSRLAEVGRRMKNARCVDAIEIGHRSAVECSQHLPAYPLRSAQASGGIHLSSWLSSGLELCISTPMSLNLHPESPNLVSCLYDAVLAVMPGQLRSAQFSSAQVSSGQLNSIRADQHSSYFENNTSSTSFCLRVRARQTAVRTCV